jgi:hypothetical protein
VTGVQGKKREDGALLESPKESSVSPTWADTGPSRVARTRLSLSPATGWGYGRCRTGETYRTTLRTTPKMRKLGARCVMMPIQVLWKRRVG